MDKQKFVKKINFRNYVKTKCGIDTFDRLMVEKGWLNRLRFFQFTLCAIVVDMFKRK